MQSRGATYQFGWLAGDAVPWTFDLRRLGWRLAETGMPDEAGKGWPLLVITKAIALNDRVRLPGADADMRQWVLVLGVDDPAERARLLELGMGDVLSSQVSLEEVEGRALRVARNAHALRPCHCIGRLRLDLMARDGFVAERRLGLHPREFALLWRLVEANGAPVAPAQLLSDVWHLTFRPETNSLAVHVSRLRAKLRLAGMDQLIETLPDGAYRIAWSGAGNLGIGNENSDRYQNLDAYLRICDKPVDCEDAGNMRSECHET